MRKATVNADSMPKAFRDAFDLKAATTPDDFDQVRIPTKDGGAILVFDFPKPAKAAQRCPHCGQAMKVKP